MFQSIIAEFGMKIMTGILFSLIVMSSYLYWKHDIVSDALEKSNEKLSEQSAILLKEKEEEVTKAKRQILERSLNAIQIYSNHFDDLTAAAARIPERVFINTKNNCSGNAVSGTAENRSKAQGGIGGTGKTELSDSNIRELDKTIRMIEEMQLKCELVLNTIE